jgi:GNAT superfamily N-acetyltransferase
MIEIRKANIEDLDLVLPLFNAYREFYRLPAEPGRARRFLQDRFANHESVIFLAFAASAPVGFVQLYPSFSSGAMAPILVLNDLFVTPQARRTGAGAALIQAAADYGRSAGAVRLTLSTELNNTTAQSLYEKTGWKRDTVFCVYQLTL